MQFTLRSIAEGERGTDQTVRELKSLVKESERRPHVRVLAVDILQQANVPNQDDLAAARAIFEWVRQHVRYYNDPVDVETVQAPEVTAWDLGAGDCDDHSALVAALARAVGIPARFVVIGDSSSRFSHIYPELKIGPEWIAADTTGGARFGEKPPDIGVRKVYNFQDSEGLGMAELAVDRQALSNELRWAGWKMLAEGWRQGDINAEDLRNYLQQLKAGQVPRDLADNTFFKPLMEGLVQDFLNYVVRNGLYSNKRLRKGLSGLSGFFGDLWGGIKSAGSALFSGGKTIVEKGIEYAPAAAAGFVTGGPIGAGVAVGGQFLSDVSGGGGYPGTPTYTGQGQGPYTVSIPIGSGQVTYSAGEAAQAASGGGGSNMPPVVVQQASAGSLLENPWVIGGAAAVLALLLLRR